jgi:hypothetical protein
MKVDMSPEAVTNRLKTMEQLWELSVNLMHARELTEANLRNEKALEKNRKDLEDITAIN